MNHERELATLKKRRDQLRVQIRTRDELELTKNQIKTMERGLDNSKVSRFGRYVGKGAKIANSAMTKAAIQYDKAQKSRQEPQQPQRKKKRRAPQQQGHSIFGPF